MGREDRAQARRWGAAAYDGAVGRRDGNCFVFAEMAFIAVIAGMYASMAHGLSTPTAIAIGIGVFVGGGILLLLPVVGLIVSLLLSVGWGIIAGNIAFHVGNQLLGIIVGIVVGLIVAGLHVGFRD
ncbi:hypothetical protein [Brachybacterium subflavum]|uniref:hypothetical protein n=1 Tax=Brachybacterium subflavum TaxID=2585206 RepID=UPI0012662AD9|nr:hypothetical protein [Brachybacterium subflavum]